MASVTEPARGTTGPEAVDAAIRLRGLSREYGERPALRDVDLELASGETLAVLGPNGAGKTTLLRILATLLRPSGGEVRVLGAELPRESWRVRGRIGYLGHQPLLYRELSVRENLAFNARLQGLPGASGRIEELLERAGLGRRGDELVRNLSAGMAQRAAICRALLAEPELLLLDEPTAHLDAGAAAIVDDLLGPVTGRTRVVITHDVEAGLGDADRVLVLAPGGSVAHAGAAGGVSVAEVRSVFTGAVE